MSDTRSPDEALREPFRRRLRPGLRIAVAVAAAGLAAIAGGLAWVSSRGGTYEVLPASGSPTSGDETRAASRLASLAPRGIHLRIDTFANRLRLYRGDELLRDAQCSTGSGVWLRDEVGGRQWFFDTPHGERRVQRKVRNPVWSKPDWAFIEEGLEPPPPGDPARFDSISLGDYALYLGDGYLIHGTLFQTLLGQSLTHGCIRLGDEDLKHVYRELPIGAPVYLY